MSDSTKGPEGQAAITIKVPTSNWNPVNQYGIPTYVQVDYTYFGSTNNVQTATYTGLGGQVVGVLTYSYVGQGKLNGDLVSKVQRTT